MLNEITNSEGVASFQLLDDTIQRFGPVFATNYVGNCSEVQFSVAEVLESGVVGKNYCNSLDWKKAMRAKPGEVVLFMHKVSFWEALCGEL
jgi:hypothetical protein